jgi:HlyD family secretion protein
MDRPISKSVKNKNRNKRIFQISAVAIVIILLFALVKSLISPSAEKDAFRFALVERGDIESTISASGLVLPSFEIMLNSPINGDIKATHFESGDRVKKGDVILELDATSTQLTYDQLKDQLELKKNNVNLLNLQYDKNLKDLEADDTIMGLKLNRLQSLLNDENRLEAIGGTSAEDKERAQMNLEIAQWEKKKLENELGYKKQSITKEKRNLELEVKIQEKKLKELHQKLSETQVKAPQDAVVTYANKSIGKKVNEGEALVRLANLSSYKVEVSFSDIHSEKVKIGMEVKVRINKTDLRGRIESISPEVNNNIIKGNVVLEESSNALLRPNMKVEVFIVTAKKDNVLKVLNGAAFTGAKTQKLFVVKGNEAIGRQVAIGINNSDYIELLGDIKEGEQIIVSDMKDYKHLEILKLSE